MTGEQLRPLEGRPYLKSWQEQFDAEQWAAAVKRVKIKAVKGKRKKGKVAHHAN